MIIEKLFKLSNSPRLLKARSYTWDLYFGSLILLGLVIYILKLYHGTSGSGMLAALILGLFCLVIPKVYKNTNRFYLFLIHSLFARVIDFYLVSQHHEMYSFVRYLGAYMLIVFAFSLFDAKKAFFISLLNSILFLGTRVYFINLPGYPNPYPDLFNTSTFISLFAPAFFLATLLYIYNHKVFESEKEYLVINKNYYNLNNSILHDFNNHLSSLSLHIQKSNKVLGSPDAFKDLLISLNNLTNFSQSMGRILKDPDRIKSNQITMDKSFLMERMKQLFSEKMKAKNISFQIEGDENFKITTNEAIFLNTILSNIISNAIKFSPKNSAISLVFKTENDINILELSDMAGGLPQRVLNSLAEDKAHGFSTLGTSGEKGHGFGLRLVQYYCHLLKIEFHQELILNGTKFSLIFKNASQA